jgi:hypothetical protein
MKKIILNSFILTAFFSLTNACKPNFKTPDVDKGEIDVTTFVSIGDAITAGCANGALYYDAQNYSYAKLLANQFEQIGGGDFKIPYISSSSIGIGNANNAPSILGNRTDCQGTTSLGPIKIATQGDLSIFTSNVYSTQGSFNNMGVADVKAIDIATNGFTNPFYVRMSSSISSSILSDAIAKKPTFFTMMIGLNDVLKYALKGATSESITPISGPVGIGFDASIENALNNLTINGAKGVVANIPSIKSLPYFNTITYNALKLSDSTAKSLTSFYSLLNPVIPFHEGNNGFVIEDASMPLGYRQSVDGELILLSIPLDSVKCYKWGSLVPIPNRYVLTISEIELIENAISNYNSILKNYATSKKLAFVDVHSFFSSIKTGFVYNGVTLNASFVSGGVFSLDGLTLTPRGNALLANEFIKAINITYKSTLPQIEATKYSGIIFP